jgi:hypothetical protein
MEQFSFDIFKKDKSRAGLLIGIVDVMGFVISKLKEHFGDRQAKSDRERHPWGDEICSS